MKKSNIYLILLFLGTMPMSYGQYWDFATPSKLSESINSTGEESMPMFSKDSSQLFFVRTFDESNKGGVKDQDIWVSQKGSNGRYGESKRLVELNNKYNNAVCGMNADGSSLYLLNCYEGRHPKESGIAVSSKKGATWGKPTSIKIPALQLKGDFINFYITDNEEYVLVSYSGSDSRGQEDLYMIKKLGDQSWSTPLNLGDAINTTGYEISPFLTKTNDTLYFSSTGHGGFGGSDIFYSVRLDESWTNWSKPVNMGNKINSSYFDAYLIKSGNQFYWSSGREGGKSDIYYTTSILPPPIKLSAVPLISYDPKVGHGIDLTALGGGGTLHYQWTSNDTIQDPMNLKAGVYTVRVRDSYGQQATLDVKLDDPSLAEMKKHMKENDATLNKDLNKNNVIYFDDNSSYLNDENIKVLNYVVPLLKAQPETKVFVLSYCDFRGTNNYNIWLSERRMIRTIEYLVQNGIDKSRIEGSYKGESEPLVNCKNCDEEQLRLNRRTTIKFVSSK
jgi:OOP family OmpA-OmpF porin